MNELLLEYYGPLIVNCMIIAVETIGLVKFLDNFLFPKRDLTLREMCGMELITCIACAFINSTFVSAAISSIFNTFLLALSFTQLAYDCIVNGIKHLIDRMFKSAENNNEGK